jgi:hypothetical protein
MLRGFFSKIKIFTESLPTNISKAMKTPAGSLRRRPRNGCLKRERSVRGLAGFGQTMAKTGCNATAVPVRPKTADSQIVLAILAMQTGKAALKTPFGTVRKQATI